MSIRNQIFGRKLITVVGTVAALGQFGCAGTMGIASGKVLLGEPQPITACHAFVDALKDEFPQASVDSCRRARRKPGDTGTKWSFFLKMPNEVSLRVFFDESVTHKLAMEVSKPVPSAEILAKTGWARAVAEKYADRWQEVVAADHGRAIERGSTRVAWIDTENYCEGLGARLERLGYVTEGCPEERTALGGGVLILTKASQGGRDWRIKHRFPYDRSVSQAPIGALPLSRVSVEVTGGNPGSGDSAQLAKQIVDEVLAASDETAAQNRQTRDKLMAEKRKVAEEKAAKAAKRFGPKPPRALRADLVVTAAQLAEMSISSIVMVSLRAPSLSPDEASALDGAVVDQASRVARVKVSSMRDIETMLGLERTKDLVGCDDVSCQAEIVGGLGADAMVAINIEAIGDSVRVSGTITAVRESVVVARADTVFKGEIGGLLGVVERVVAGLLEVAQLTKP